MFNILQLRGGKFGPGEPRIDYRRDRGLTPLETHKMPQATNLKVRRDMDLSPCGPGTVFNTCVHISNTIRERANTINKTEEARLAKIQKIIDKEQRFKNNVQAKVIDKTTKVLKEKQALLQLLSNEYRVNNFITMKPDFDPNTIDTRNEARRYVMETRIFNSGFNMKALKPEVNRRLRKLDPNHKYRSFKKKLLASNKEQNIVIDRTMADTTFYRMLHDKNNWRDYSLSKSRWTPYGGTRPDDEAVADKVDTGDRIAGGSGQEEPRETKEVEETEQDLTKEKSVVLERRLPRQTNNAFGMTMRTLGPVYFQSSVQPLPDIDPKPVTDVPS